MTPQQEPLPEVPGSQNKPGLITLIEPPGPTGPNERWATIACYGTWNDRKTRGTYDKDELTHVQRIYDLMPEPKLELEGLGQRHGRIGKAIGGAFGVGAEDRVDRAVRWLDGRTFDRLLVIGGSRGAAVAGALIQEMDNRLDKSWRLGEWTDEMRERGETFPPWCHVDCLVLIDPVLSMGFHAPAKWMLRFVPDKVKWHFNIDRYRTLPAFVRVQIATYALAETRRAFEPTHFRLTHPDARSWRRWLCEDSVHSDHLGYGPHEQTNIDVGSWLRSAISLRIPMLRDADWPWPALDRSQWQEVTAKPLTRRTLPGDLAMIRQTPKGAS